MAPVTLRRALLPRLLLVLLLASPAGAEGVSGVEGQAIGEALAAEGGIGRLLDVLRDDQARAALVAALEAASAGTGSAAPVTPAERPESLALGLAAAARAQANTLWAQLADLGGLATRLPSVGPEERRRGAGLLATILMTIAASLAAEGAAGVVARRLRPPDGAGPARRAGRALLGLLAHLGAVLLAWIAGLAVALALVSDQGRPFAPQLLYLDAFLAFGLVRVALRGAANPDAAREPALSPLDPRAQAVLHRSLLPVAGVIAQGFLFLAPALGLWAGAPVAQGARTLLATLAAVLALRAIRLIARALDAASPAVAEPPAGASPADPSLVDPQPGTFGPPAPDPSMLPPEPVRETGPAVEAMGSAWRWLWPPLAVAHVLYAWAVAVTRPALAEGIVLAGSLATALALAMVVAALHLWRRSHRLAAPLPARVLALAPTLRPRADRILAALGRALAVLVLLTAPMVVLLGWNAALVARLAALPWVWSLLGQAASAGLVVLGAALIWAGVASWIDARLARSEAGGTARARTLLALFRNAFTVAVVVLGGMVALSQLGLDIAPLLAGAGVVGLAIGFGAQTLVKDIITGIFIQLEGAIDVGDVVGVAGITGGVERVTIRSVRLRTMDGAVHLIPFSSVTTVTNLTRDFGYHVADLAVGYGESVPAVRAAMEEAFARLLTEPLSADVEGGLDMQGVAELRGDAVLVRARIRTRAGRQWDVGRRYSEILKGVLDERGIVVPVASRTMMVPDPGAAAAPLAAAP